MIQQASIFFSVDLPAALAALLACLSCALMGNFLVLQRQSLMGDAISHAVLPGIVAGFLMSGSRAALPMLAGALVAALLASVLIDAARRLGRLDPGTAMGVVFTGMFALGVILIEQGGARQVDLDADCALYGQLEAIVWFEAHGGWASMLDPAILATMPRQIIQLFLALAFCSTFVFWFWKELTLVSFDPQQADMLGFSSAFFQRAVVVLSAVVAIAAFEAVGSILVIAMLICPAATARLYCERMGSQMALALGLGGFSALAGYALAGFAPPLFGFDHAVNAAGTIACLSGIILAIAAITAPRHGILARHRRLA
jgi:manganese/zinc/iron transport system permease protein